MAESALMSIVALWILLAQQASQTTFKDRWTYMAKSFQVTTGLSSLAEGARYFGLLLCAALALLVVSNDVAAVPSTTDLVAHWSYDQSSGTVLNDDSGNGHNGTFSGTPTWTAGVVGNGLALNETDNVELGDIAAINGVNKLTLATWLKRSVTGGMVLVGKQTTNHDVAIEAWEDGSLYFQLSNGSDTYGYLTLSDTAWHHVALVYDGTLSGNANRLKAYVDGVQRTLTFNGTVPATTTVNTTPLNIGGIQGSYSNGQVDDTWLYARALSLAEVNEIRLSGSDSVSPSVPDGFGASAVSHNQINLSWIASTDDVAVAGYRIFRDSVERTTTSATTFQDAGLTPNTTYTYTVRAYDVAGNQSAHSVSSSATTFLSPAAPTAAITAIPSVVAGGGSSTLTWSTVNATNCNASGSWSGGKATSGSEVKSGIAANSTYTLTCVGPGGQAVASATVTVLPQCSDGVDNDGDSRVDADDPGCSSPTDNSEADPDTVAPNVSISSPAQGATVSGSVVVSANASDNVGVVGVRFYANGALIASEDASAPYSVTWNSTSAENGIVQLTAVARDVAGNTNTAAVNVTVDNVQTRRYVTGLSSNSRYFVDQVGDPILIKADSPWSMFCNLSAADVELWAANRESLGFNTAIVALIGHTTNGCPAASGATYDGVLPFNGGDVTSWNEAYWTRIDSYMTILMNHGITVILYPMDGWNTLPDGVFAGKSNASIYTYGQMVATRYAGYPNIIWNAGGDYNGWDNIINGQFQNLLNGIRAAGDTRLFSTQLGNETVTTDIAFYERLAQWNFVYTYTTTYQKVLRAYNRAPGVRDPRPALFGEGNYEREDWYGSLPTTDETLRRQQLWALTSGSPGEILGTEDWQFLDAWQTRLGTTWILQATKNRNLFSTLNWHLLVPDEATPLVIAGRGTKITTDQSLDVRANDYVTAAQTPDKSQAVIYVPTNTGNTNARTITLDLTLLLPGYTATWVDPTDATVSQPAIIDGSGRVTTPGLHADGTRDWLLVIR
ncbi:apiosidase-like domain-containing protein [Steroidobacter agaridevorans]|uniref:apiosidase-like domain-containing protein n=1 Tax=Steroidobacter agaridevorans TaxID=2695856 RepID=UPI001323AD1E|nr:DUF4038 domain-containing protein [Steroidobacter agaridevorans]GFE85215.1 hypothetical protein GCM10011488_01690 [Steroidobacter agaridevorans]